MHSAARLRDTALLPSTLRQTAMPWTGQVGIHQFSVRSAIAARFSDRAVPLCTTHHFAHFHAALGVDWTVGAYEDDSPSESTSQRSPLRSPSSTSMVPMGDDAAVVIAALSQRLRREQSRSQSLQRELQVLRSSEAMTFDIQVRARCLLNVRWPRSLDCSGRCRGSKVCEAATSAGLKLLNQLPPLSHLPFPPLSFFSHSMQLNVLCRQFIKQKKNPKRWRMLVVTLWLQPVSCCRCRGIQLVCSACIAGLILLSRAPSFTHIFSGFKLFGVGAIFRFSATTRRQAALG
jgi:hypothetical protein